MSNLASATIHNRKHAIPGRNRAAHPTQPIGVYARLKSTTATQPRGGADLTGGVTKDSDAFATHTAG
jgi:hypothetical protein